MKKAKTIKEKIEIRNNFHIITFNSSFLKVKINWRNSRMLMTFNCLCSSYFSQACSTGLSLIDNATNASPILEMIPTSSKSQKPQRPIDRHCRENRKPNDSPRHYYIRYHRSEDWPLQDEKIINWNNYS